MWFLRADINECTEEDAICGPHCNCTNSIGSYFCDCIKGYRLDNFDVIASASNPCTGARPLDRTHTYDLIRLWHLTDLKEDNVFSHRHWRVLWATGHLRPQHRVHQYPRNLLLLLPWWILSLHRNLLDSWDVVLPKWAKPGLNINLCESMLFIIVSDVFFNCF